MWPTRPQGQKKGNYDSDGFQARTLHYSLRRVSPLDSVNCRPHNPKVGGSNPPPNQILSDWLAPSCTPSRVINASHSIEGTVRLISLPQVLSNFPTSSTDASPDPVRRQMT